MKTPGNGKVAKLKTILTFESFDTSIISSLKVPYVGQNQFGLQNLFLIFDNTISIPYRSNMMITRYSQINFHSTDIVAVPQVDFADISMTKFEFQQSRQHLRRQSSTISHRESDDHSFNTTNLNFDLVSGLVPTSNSDSYFYIPMSTLASNMVALFLPTVMSSTTSPTTISNVNQVLPEICHLWQEFLFGKTSNLVYPERGAILGNNPLFRLNLFMCKHGMLHKIEVLSSNTAVSIFVPMLA